MDARDYFLTEKVASDTSLRNEIETLGKRLNHLKDVMQQLKVGLFTSESELKIAQNRESEIREQLNKLITNREISALNVGPIDTEVKKKKHEKAQWKLQWRASIGTIITVILTIIAGLFALTTSNIASPVFSYFFIAKRFLWSSIMTDVE